MSGKWRGLGISLEWESGGSWTRTRQTVQHCLRQLVSPGEGARPKNSQAGLKVTSTVFASSQWSLVSKQTEITVAFLTSFNHCHHSDEEEEAPPSGLTWQETRLGLVRDQQKATFYTTFSKNCASKKTQQKTLKTVLRHLNTAVGVCGSESRLYLEIVHWPIYCNPWMTDYSTVHLLCIWTT